jgi:hypothetical protein
VLTIRDLKQKLKELNQGEGPNPASIQEAWSKLQQADCRDSASHRKQMRQVTGGGLKYWIQTSAPWITGVGLAMVLGGIYF